MMIIALEKYRRPGAGIVPLEFNGKSILLDLYNPRFLGVPGDMCGLPQVLRRFLRPGDTFIDGGANHGTFSITASHLVGSHGLVISIEPQPRLATLLRTLLAYGPAPHEVHEVACGNGSGQVDLFIPTASSGSAGVFSTFSGFSEHAHLRAKLCPLDDILDWRRLPGRVFIKVDVEGSELAFLKGARELIRHTRPKILLEVNPSSMRAAGVSLDDLRGVLRELGYTHFVTPQAIDSQPSVIDEDLPLDIIIFPEPHQCG
jgi:FkbM family methyltransferase